MTTYATFNGQLGFRFNVSLGLALFLAPVLISAYRIFRSGGRSSLYPSRSSVFAEMERSRREERSAFAFLCFFAFIPILSLFAVCQAIPQMIWLPRGLIIAAAPYLMLVSMAVHRFGSRLVRGGVLCALLCWASAAGFKSLDQIDYRKIDWGSVVEQMKLRGGAEKGRTIPVYVTDRFHAYSLKFYLRWVDEKGFNVVFADGSGFTHPSIQPRFLRQLESVRVERLDELRGDRFWVIFICDEWQRAEWPQRAFNPAEFAVGDLFSDPLGQVCAFPVGESCVRCGYRRQPCRFWLQRISMRKGAVSEAQRRAR